VTTSPGLGLGSELPRRRWTYLSLGLTESKQPLLKLKIMYKGERMLVITRFWFRIDGIVETIEPAKPLKSDYVADEFREWLDESALPNLEVLREIARGKFVLMRYEGAQYKRDREVSTMEKTSLGEMLLVYRYLKEQPGMNP
jgi:hypothetical protein